MKTIIAGSRTIQSYDVVAAAIESSGFAKDITEVFSGMASGPDIFGYRWAIERKLPVRQFLPDWKKLGKPAGIIRNMEMATYADAAVVVWDGKSTGTGHLLSYFKKLSPPVRVHLVIYKPETGEQTLVEQGRKQSNDLPTM